MFTQPNLNSYFDQFKGGMKEEPKKGVDPLTQRLIDISKQNPASVAGQVVAQAGLVKPPQTAPSGPAGLPSVLNNAQAAAPSVLQRIQAMQQAQGQPAPDQPPPDQAAPQAPPQAPPQMPPQAPPQVPPQGMAEGGIASLPIEVGQFAEGGVVGFDGGGQVPFPTMESAESSVQKMYDNPNLPENQLLSQVTDYLKQRPQFESEATGALKALRQKELAMQANQREQLPYWQTAQLFHAAATPGQSADALSLVQKAASDIDAKELGSAKDYASTLIALKQKAWEASDPSKILSARLSVDQALNPRAQTAEGAYRTGAIMYDVQQRTEQAKRDRALQGSKAATDKERYDFLYSNRILEETNGHPEAATPSIKARVAAEVMQTIGGAPRAESAEVNAYKVASAQEDKWDAANALLKQQAYMSGDQKAIDAFEARRDAEFKRIESSAKSYLPSSANTNRGIGALPAAAPTANPTAAPLAAPTMQIPKIGDIVSVGSQRFKFNGGNPADNANYSPVNK